VVALLVVFGLERVIASDPSYDHQDTTYRAGFKPVVVSDKVISVMPYFSPDYSIDVLVEMIQSAQSSVDISTPGFSSWSGCSFAEEGGCAGCYADKQKYEEFPVFPALLNAIHERNVSVRILTNDYGDKTCFGKVTPLDWLLLNGVEIKFYKTTTFTHSKYTSVDGKNASISSVNFSKTSFLKNREAGVVLGQGAEDLVDMAQKVFENDWSEAFTYTYDPSPLSNEDLAIIKSTEHLPVKLPNAPSIPNAYVTPRPAFITEKVSATLFTSPDFSFDTLNAFFSGAKESLSIMIYQVTGEPLCNLLIEMSQKVNFSLLVSADIYDKEDHAEAHSCYTKMSEQGVRIRQTPKYYSYSHQKFAIVDGSSVLISTGNLSPSDFTKQATFPPYGTSGWSKINRDYSIILTNSKVVSIFQNVMSEDWIRGSDWESSQSQHLSKF
jgi:phosphatidylserine/phosphatidylglycerophosphate/cardiolipin synthase-like enzyme